VNKTDKTILWIILLLAFLSANAFSQIPDSERLKKLGSLLGEIEVSAWVGRAGGVSISLFLGIFAGAVATSNYEFYTGSSSASGEMGCANLIGMGSSCLGGVMIFSLGVTIGILPGLFTTVMFPFENIWMPARFRGMPENTDDEIQVKIDTGEKYLREIARLENITGVVRAIFFLAVGGTGIGMFSYYGTATGPNTENLRYWSLGVGVGFLALGIVDLFVKEKAQECLERYNDWNSGSAAALTSAPGRPMVQILFSPVLAGVRVSF